MNIAAQAWSENPTMISMSAQLESGRVRSTFSLMVQIIANNAQSEIYYTSLSIPFDVNLLSLITCYCFESQND